MTQRRQTNTHTRRFGSLTNCVPTRENHKENAMEHKMRPEEEEEEEEEARGCTRCLTTASPADGKRDYRGSQTMVVEAQNYSLHFFSLAYP